MNPIPSAFASEKTSGAVGPHFNLLVAGSVILHSAIVSGSEQSGAAAPPPTATAADLTFAVGEPFHTPNGRWRGGLCVPPSRPLRILTAVILRGSATDRGSKQSRPLLPYRQSPARICQRPKIRSAPKASMVIFWS